jgi:hypothetical protein
MDAISEGREGATRPRAFKAGGDPASSGWSDGKGVWNSLLSFLTTLDVAAFCKQNRVAAATEVRNRRIS